MKKVINGLAVFLLFMGIIAIAGSANDCDGNCMETANTLGEMLMVCFIGLCLVATGGAILIKNGGEA
tara:strand:+ start:1009 stop:1209 length:201 start_codon:yes stop_codon:yes gene_type:complete